MDSPEHCVSVSTEWWPRTDVHTDERAHTAVWYGRSELDGYPVGVLGIEGDLWGRDNS